MAIMKFNEIKKMSNEEKEKKLKELKLELMKSKISSGKGSKTREIKKIIARIKSSNTQKK